MRLEDFVIQFTAPMEVVELERRWCTCHCREIWVVKGEPWPYFCSDNPKLLPAGDVAAII